MRPVVHDASTIASVIFAILRAISILALCAIRAATRVSDLERISPARRSAFVLATASSRRDFLFWSRNAPSMPCLAMFFIHT